MTYLVVCCVVLGIILLLLYINPWTESDSNLQETNAPVVVDERNWKGIIISLLVIITILSFIGLAIFILTPSK